VPGVEAFAWFPVAGALLGLGVGALWWAANELLGRLAGAATAVVADLALTGALHFDGLVDSADGLLPHFQRERRLAVMAEPCIGAFGVAAGASVLLLRTAALWTLAGRDGARPLLLGALWSASRSQMAVAARALPYARPAGLATSFLGSGRSLGLGLAGTILAAGLAAADGARMLLAVAAAVTAGALVHALARRRLGGFTGDTLGASGVVAETVGLLVAVALVRR